MSFHQLFYYSFARFLPKSTVPVFGKPALRIRMWACRRLFRKDAEHRCEDLNVEQGAYFGSGKDFTVGSHVGLGKNFKSLNRIVTIDDYLMMEEDVTDWAVVGGNPARGLKYRR